MRLYRWLPILFSVAVLYLSCNDDVKPMKSTTVDADISQSQAQRLLGIASTKAREVGYQVEKLNYSIQRNTSVRTLIEQIQLIR